VISQIALTNNQKALFAGVGEEGRPGAVKILSVPLGFLTEVQAHSKPIERMKLSYDNKGLPWSDEILTEKTEIEGYQTEKEQLENDFNNAS
jgi:hypothetical protein